MVIIGNQKYTDPTFLKLKLRTPSEVSYTDFSEGVNNLSATGNFAGIDYHFQELPGTDHNKLVLQVLESGSRTSLRVAAHYDQLFHSAGLANITRKRLFTNNDVASLDLIVGTTCVTILIITSTKGTIGALDFLPVTVFSIRM